MIKRFVVVAGCLLLASCAATRMTSVRDPSAARSTFRNILVIAPFSDLESRTAAENIFVAKLGERGVSAIASITVMPPTKEYTEVELLRILDDSRTDGIIIVSLTDAYTKETYVPQSSTTTGSASLYGNFVNYSSRTQHHGGYYISKPRVHYELRLLDVSTGNTAWLATSLTRGNAFAGFNTLMRSLARRAVQKLAEDGVIP